MSEAMYDFAIKHKVVAQKWSPKEVGKTYPMKHNDQTQLFAEVWAVQNLCALLACAPVSLQVDAPRDACRRRHAAVAQRGKPGVAAACRAPPLIAV